MLLFWNLERRYIQIVYESFINGHILNCKLVHISRDNNQLKYLRDSQGTGIKVEKNAILF